VHLLARKKATFGFANGPEAESALILQDKQEDFLMM
jgi:hypothetical protein